ncbi:MAG: class I SAM-dependent methyltransferase [Myxococcota bacterium]
MTGSPRQSDDLYDVNVEYYDLVSRTRVEALTSVVGDWASQVPAEERIVDLGAGTGRLTVVAARAAAGSDIDAIEPSRSMRAVLAARICDDDDLIGRVTIVPLGVPEAWSDIPNAVGGFMMLGALPHLEARERGALLGEIATRLVDGGSALVEVMQPWVAAEIPRQRFASVAMGRHRIEGLMQAEPSGDDALVWTMTYRRVAADGAVLDEVSGSTPCWVVGPDRFAAEAAAAGLTVKWRTDELAELAELRRG